MARAESGLRRGSLVGEGCFLVSLMSLLAALLVEFIYNLVRLSLFLTRRASHRERVRRIMFHGSQSSLAALLAGLVLLAAAGCSPREPMEGPGQGKGGPGSFRRQVYELGWSIRTLADQSDSQRSLEQDLQSLRTDPKWKENLLWDARHLFTMEDARRSLESDLKSLSASDHPHGILETLRMTGW